MVNEINLNLNLIQINYSMLLHWQQRNAYKKMIFDPISDKEDNDSSF